MLRRKSRSSLVILQRTFVRICDRGVLSRQLFMSLCTRTA